MNKFIPIHIDEPWIERSARRAAEFLKKFEDGRSAMCNDTPDADELCDGAFAEVEPGQF